MFKSWRVTLSASPGLHIPGLGQDPIEARQILDLKFRLGIDKMQLVDVATVKSTTRQVMSAFMINDQGPGRAKRRGSHDPCES